MKRAVPTWILFLGVVIAMAWVFNRNRIRAERQAAALQREERLGVERQRLLRERASLKARQPSAQEITGLVADSAAARSIRAHIAEMKQRIAGKPSAPHEPFADSTPVTAISWTYAGQVTPRAALMSVLWTASHGDVDRLADLIEFSGPVRTEADAFFAQLPLASQQEYGSPERVVATLLAGNFPKDAEAAIYEGGGGNTQSAHVELTIHHAEGDSRTNVYSLDFTDSGWRLQVPSDVLAGYEKILQGESTSGIAGSKP